VERYHWLKNKTPEHIEKFRASMTDNWHAFKHGRYSQKKHTVTCAMCQLAYYCPYYRKGSFCIIIRNWIDRQWMQLCAGGLPKKMEPPPPVF